MNRTIYNSSAMVHRREPFHKGVCSDNGWQVPGIFVRVPVYCAKTPCDTARPWTVQSLCSAGALWASCCLGRKGSPVPFISSRSFSLGKRSFGCTGGEWGSIVGRTAIQKGISCCRSGPFQNNNSTLHGSTQSFTLNQAKP